MEESLTVFQTDEELLTCLRNFYDWESRRDTYPHRPPELARISHKILAKGRSSWHN
jgi:hypothetical protein